MSHFPLFAVLIVLLLVMRRVFARWFSGRTMQPASLTPPSAPVQILTLEQKLEQLAGCGLKLATPFTVDDLLSSWDRSEYEEPGYTMVLVGLGMTEEQEPWRNHCVNLWHFDTECIEHKGSYVAIAQRMAEMTQGALVLENIRDHVDLDNEKEAWFAFTWRGQEIRVDCKVNDDWVDPDIFATFVKLLESEDPTKLYLYYDLEGQDFLIGCVTRDEWRRLTDLGIKFEPLR